MDRYKKLWKELKLNIGETNPEIVTLMNDLEHRSKRKKATDKRGNPEQPKKYGIVLTAQPWWDTYSKVRNMLYLAVVRNKTIPKQVRSDFYKEFSEKMRALASMKLGHNDVQNWLESKWEEYKKTYQKAKLPGTTPSGFERKPLVELSNDECAAIVIDKLVYIYKPKLPDSFLELNIDYYKEDWRQELWMWLWERRYKDVNLMSLILNYRALSKQELSFYTSHILSRMNKYAINYIIKLQCSCCGVSECYMSTTYDNKYEDTLYPANDLSSIETASIVEIDDEIIDNVDNKKLIQKIMDYFDEQIKYNCDNPYKTRNSWIRDKQVLEMRYGFNPENRIYTLEEIGKKLGVTRERVRQMETQILRVCRKQLKGKGEII